MPVGFSKMAEVKPATDDNLQPFGNIVQSGCGVPKKWKRCSPKCCHRSRPLLEWVSTILYVFFIFLQVIVPEHVTPYPQIYFGLVQPSQGKQVS